MLEQADIGSREEKFLDASRRALKRKQQARRAMALFVPLLFVLIYAGYQLKLRRDLKQRVDAHVQEGVQVLTRAQALNAELDKLRSQAFAAFDAQSRQEGEVKWARVLERSAEMDELYARASQSLEAALTLDGGRQDVRNQLADVLYERAGIADRDGNSSRLRDLLARMALYDPGGQRVRSWSTPARIDLQTTPAGALVTVARYVENKRHRLELVEERSLGTTPLLGAELTPGSYLLTLHAAGRVEVRYPLVARRAEQLKLVVPMPEMNKVPAGFVYIPPGRFLFGAGGDDRVRRLFLYTVPLHDVWTEGYMIGRYEVTYGDWIEYLKALPPLERAKRTMHSEQATSVTSVELKEL